VLNELALSKKRVWIFSSGPTGKGDPGELINRREIPNNMKKIIERIGPVDIALFHGKIDYFELNFVERIALKVMKIP
jgi:hypothetical protein